MQQRYVAMEKVVQDCIPTSKEIRFCSCGYISFKTSVPFQMKCTYHIRKRTFKYLLQNRCKKIGTKDLWLKGIQRATPFSEGRWWRNSENTLSKFKKTLLQNFWVNFNQTWHKHSWVKSIQVCANEGSCLIPRGDNDEIAKIHCRNLRNLFSRTSGPISTKLDTKHSWVKGIQICSNEGHSLSQGEMIAK